MCVCVRPRGVAAESLEIYTHWVVVMKVEIVVMVAVVVSVSVSVSESESASESESECVSASVRVKVSLSESKSESAQNLHFEVHQELRLPRNLRFRFNQVLGPSEGSVYFTCHEM